MMPFDVDGNHYKSEYNKDKIRLYNYDDAVIFGYNGNVAVGKQDDNTLRIVAFGGGIYNSILEKVVEKVEILDEYRLEGEGYFDIKYSDIDKVANILRLKKQASTPIGLLDMKNYTYWLRIMRNTNPNYNDKLKAYIKNRKK